MEIGKMVEVTTEEWEVVEVVCNKCGKSNKELGQDPDYLGSFRYNGGYGSNGKEAGIWDLTEYKWHMCELCMGALFRSFKVPVSQFNHIDGKQEQGGSVHVGSDGKALTPVTWADVGVTDDGERYLNTEIFDAVDQEAGAKAIFEEGKEYTISEPTEADWEKVRKS